jgi:hypothetical protein
LSKSPNDCYSWFEYLSIKGNLPERFSPALAEVITNLQTLFTKGYPLALTHGDLNEMNILVNHDTGHITGVVDWAEGTILPFGFALYALESTLGNMGSKGWEYFNNAEDLRNEFWIEFSQRVGKLQTATMKAIHIARNAGIFIRYGIAFDSGFEGVVGVRDTRSDDHSQYLDALLKL